MWITVENNKQFKGKYIDIFFDVLILSYLELDVTCVKCHEIDFVIGNMITENWIVMMPTLL